MSGKKFSLQKQDFLQSRLVYRVITTVCIAIQPSLYRVCAEYSSTFPICHGLHSALSCHPSLPQTADFHINPAEYTFLLPKCYAPVPNAKINLWLLNSLIVLPIQFQNFFYKFIIELPIFTNFMYKWRRYLISSVC